MNIEKENKKRVSVSNILLIASAGLMMFYLLHTLPVLGFVAVTGIIPWIAVAVRVLYIFVACSIAVPAVLSDGAMHKVFKIILAVWFAIGFIGIFLYLDYAFGWGVFE